MHQFGIKIVAFRRAKVNGVLQFTHFPIDVSSLEKSGGGKSLNSSSNSVKKMSIYLILIQSKI